MNKIQKLKEIVKKIDIIKIINHWENNPKSKSLKEIIKYSKRALDSEKEEEVFKSAVSLAHNFDNICDENKGGYVKNEEEKKYWLELSKELFENTLGVK